MNTPIRWSLLAIFTAAFVSSTPLSTSHDPPFRSSPALRLAPLVQSEHPHGTINNSYMIVFKQNIPTTLIQNHFNFVQAAHDSDPLVADDALSGVRHVYEGCLNGYAGRFTDTVIEQIRSMSEVAYVERDQIVRISDIQKGAPWVRLHILADKPLLLLMTCTGPRTYQPP